MLECCALLLSRRLRIQARERIGSKRGLSLMVRNLREPCEASRTLAALAIRFAPSEHPLDGTVEICGGSLPCIRDLEGTEAVNNTAAIFRRAWGLFAQSRGP